MQHLTTLLRSPEVNNPLPEQVQTGFPGTA